MGYMKQFEEMNIIEDGEAAEEEEKKEPVEMMKASKPNKWMHL